MASGVGLTFSYVDSVTKHRFSDEEINKIKDHFLERIVEKISKNGIVPVKGFELAIRSSDPSYIEESSRVSVNILDQEKLDSEELLDCDPHAGLMPVASERSYPLSISRDAITAEVARRIAATALFILDSPEESAIQAQLGFELRVLGGFAPNKIQYVLVPDTYEAIFKKYFPREKVIVVGTKTHEFSLAHARKNLGLEQYERFEFEGEGPDYISKVRELVTERACIHLTRLPTEEDTRQEIKLIGKRISAVIRGSKGESEFSRDFGPVFTAYDSSFSASDHSPSGVSS